MVPVTLVEQVRWNFLAIGDDDCRQLGREQPLDRCAQRLFGQAAQVARFGGTDQLDAKRMDEIHMPDLTDGRLQRGFSGQHAIAALTTGKPGQAKTIVIVLEQTLDADLPDGAAVAH